VWDSAIFQLFGAQYNVASVEQLVDLGLSVSTINRARRRGVLSVVVPGVVRLAGSAEPFESKAMALLLRTSSKTFLSGPTAGALWGLRGMPTSRVELTLPELERTRRRPGWAKLVYASWIDPDVDFEVRSDGLRVARPLRMLFGLAGQFNQHRFERAAEDAWHRKLVTPEEAADYLATVRRSGRGGVTRFETWLQKAERQRRPSATGLEQDFIDMIRCAGLPEPERQHPLTLRNGVTIHIDVAWPDVRLGIEPGHTWWHGGDLRQRADQARVRRCNELGWLIIPYDEQAADGRESTIAELAQIYRERVRTFLPRESGQS
jgi:Transcriptional regulator, AbiEi antitoxin